MKKINGKDFKGMIASGAANLENNEKEMPIRCASNYNL